MTHELISLDNLNQTPQPLDRRLAAGYHQIFSTYHNHVYEPIMDALHMNGNSAPPGKHFPIGYHSIHTDQSQFYAVLEETGFIRPHTVIAPVWFAPPLDKTLFATCEMANAFVRSKRQGTKDPTITDNFITMFIYAELRQDDDGPDYLKSEYWNQTARESNTALLLADTIIGNGIKGAIFLDPHSEKSMRYFSSIETLCLTAIPLFAKWIVDNHKLDDNSKIVALDIGALQKCMLMQDILRRITHKDIGLVVYHKKRSGHSKIDQQTLIYGEPKGSINIIVDESVASGGSLADLARTQIGEKIACITHGILCKGYAKNIRTARKSGLTALALSNSLPQTREVNYMPVSFSTIPIEVLMSFFGKEVAARSIKEVREDPRFNDFVLTPKPKTEVLQTLIQRAKDQGRTKEIPLLSQILEAELEEELTDKFSYSLLGI
jgi:phosphoribosylpyrophosphate synthetase